MGAWSTAPFGNDDALDWFADLKEASEAFPFIQETLAVGSTDSIVAAGAVLVVLSGHSEVDAHPHVVEWADGRSVPPQDLKLSASNAIQEIIDDPDADGQDVWAELGEDDEDYLAWLSNLRTIQALLR
jgi:hypothetical protein